MSSSAAHHSIFRGGCVVMPALNEAASVAEAVRGWLELGVRRVRVVDNGSEDDTAERAVEAGAEVLTETARGYGAAASKGLQSWPAECHWVWFAAADGSDVLTPGDSMAWQGAADAGADLVIGNRTARARARTNLKLSQQFGNWLCCEVIGLGWGRRFQDMGSLRLIRIASLERMQLRDRAFGWNVEMQVRALELDLGVVELPVDYLPRRAGESKISGSVRGTIRAGIGMVRMLGHLWRLRRERAARLTADAVEAHAR